MNSSPPLEHMRRYLALSWIFENLFGLQFEGCEPGMFWLLCTTKGSLVVSVSLLRIRITFMGQPPSLGRKQECTSCTCGRLLTGVYGMTAVSREFKGVGRSRSMNVISFVVEDRLWYELNGTRTGGHKVGGKLSQVDPHPEQEVFMYFFSNICPSTVSMGDIEESALSSLELYLCTHLIRSYCYAVRVYRLLAIP